MRTSMTQSQVEKNILEYILENPYAKDDLQGIADWWLMKQNISDSIDFLSISIENLVMKGYLHVFRVESNNIVYSLNRDKIDEIKVMIGFKDM